MNNPVLLLTRVAPVLGVLTSTLLFFSPLQAARQAKATQSLGELNVIPYPLIAANCCGWVVYSICVRDPYIFCANALGVLVGLYMTLLSLPLADKKTANQIMATVLFSALLLEVVGFLGAERSLTKDELKFLWGAVANAILIIFYCAPLSSLIQVFQSRSNRSLHLPMAAMTVVNGSLWLAYGLAVDDFFVYIPNGVGTVLGLVQLLLYFIFRQKKNGDLDVESPLLSAEQSAAVAS